jgi:hypothetical protein
MQALPCDSAPRLDLSAYSRYRLQKLNREAQRLSLATADELVREGNRYSVGVDEVVVPIASRTLRMGIARQSARQPPGGLPGAGGPLRG